MTTVRVATSQYTVTDDIDANLAKLLEVIDRAADGGARLIAVPEFCNHTCIYRDEQHAWDVAIDLESDFLTAVRDKARERGIYVVINAPRRGEDFPTIYDTNYLIGPDGEIVGLNNKQVLIGVEHEFITPSPIEGPVFETEIGRIGLYSCMDGVFPETPRSLAMNGAQILVNTLNSMAHDEPALHVPVRAAENGVWVISANKVGPIVGEAATADSVERLQIDPHILDCLGEVQIVSPSGEVIASGAIAVEDVIFADVDMEEADDKRWADGDLFKDRRPDTYRLVASDTLPEHSGPTPPPFEAAVVQVRSDRPFDINLYRALDVASDAAETGARLVVLPELFPFSLRDVIADPDDAVERSRTVLAEMKRVAKARRVFLAASLATSDAGVIHHSGVLIGDDGEEVGRYHQIHLTDSFKRWATAGSDYQVWDTSLGRIGMMVGYDGAFPEPATILARMGADAIVYPTTWRLQWETGLGVSERAAENRVAILAAARWDSPVKRGGMVIPAPASRSIAYGNLSPIWPMEAPHDRELYLRAEIDPAQSRQKLIGRDDVLAGRRPELYRSLVAEPAKVPR